MWLSTCHTLPLKVVCYASEQSIQLHKNEMTVDTQYMLLFQVWLACYTCYYYYYYDYSFMNDHLAHSLYSLLARSVDLVSWSMTLCWDDRVRVRVPLRASSRQESLGKRGLPSNGVVVIISCKKNNVPCTTTS